ncbi:hypothetical protein BT63DRAFT_410237 [Microthyrium microscopicum]|uniref:Uncharacterized protein n=1 Tax=Microthyrium microscopicum TaxID=703497 RepID=A0A6A6UQK2_9PEZI|nr:hypothetical protein BT63DRAFT_410237 [Microthyrium microscopicum]
MKQSALAVSALAIGASASAIKRELGERHKECTWSFYAESPSWKGAVVQITDGQIQIHEYQGKGDCYPFKVEGGYMKDQNDFGCIVTEPQKQIQCDHGNPGQEGFSVQNHNLAYHGSECIYACPIDDNGNWNIYTVPVPNQLKCVEVKLHGEYSCDKKPEHQGWDDKWGVHHDGDTDDETDDESEHPKGCHECSDSDSDSDDSSDEDKHACYKTCTVTKHHTDHHTKTKLKTDYKTKVKTDYKTKHYTDYKIKHKTDYKTKHYTATVTEKCKDCGNHCHPSCHKPTEKPKPKPKPDCEKPTGTGKPGAPFRPGNNEPNNCNPPHPHPPNPPPTPAAPTKAGPPPPTGKPCGCHHEDHECSRKCKTTTATSYTTAMVTVTQYRPIPCNKCQGQQHCYETCTTVATATATTTVYEPCKQKCGNDFKCYDNCHQPRPTCGHQGGCGNWDEYDGSYDAGWGYKPRPQGYNGYWPYDQNQGRPQKYGGYWKGDYESGEENCGNWPYEERGLSERAVSEAGSIDEMITTFAANATELIGHKRRYGDCCSKCDYRGDPEPCHNRCAQKECEAKCYRNGYRNECCFRKCKLLFPAPCVPEYKCPRPGNEHECHRCGWGHHPSAEFFIY